MCSEPQTDVDFDGCPGSESKDDFEGISPEQLNRMMEEMKYLIGETERREAALPVESTRLRVHTLLIQAEVAKAGFCKDIMKEVDSRRQAVSLIPDEDAQKWYQLDTLGNALIQKFERLGDPMDINEAIQCVSQALQLMGDWHPMKLSVLNKLGRAYNSRFDQLGDLTDNDKAIECNSQAVLLASNDDPDKRNWHNDLGCAYLSRFERIGDLADIGKAIECLSQTVLLTPDGHADEQARLNNLACAYQSRFERLGERDDIDKAIEYKSQVVLLTPDGHADKPGWHNNLGCAYHSRFERLDEFADIEKAIESLSQAVSLTADGHAEKPARHNNLACAYHSRFERLGELGDIDKAVENHGQAVLLTPDGYADKPGWHGNLGCAYQSRFQRLGELADLNKAIQCHSGAVLLTPDDHADKPGRYSDLGISYKSRFDLLGELSDIDKAVDSNSLAVLLTPDGHADKPGWHNNLGSAYQSRFDRFGELGDIDKAIECKSQAVLLTPDGHADKPNRHNNLGMAYQSRFERLGELADIDKAIECLSQAVLLTPIGHAAKPARQSNLGHAFHSRFQSQQRLPDLESAHSAFQCASLLVVTNPATQLNAARHWAAHSLLLGRSAEPAYARCMELIPRLIWLGTTVHQRYTLLSHISDLATEAASWAISVHSYELALEWLEAGRSIVWNQILHLRTPFDELSAVDPVLARHLKALASRLDRAGLRPGGQGPSISSEVDLEEAAQSHRRLADEWELGLEQARRIAGFSNFMRLHKATDLKMAARDGPVIVINTHTSRCDALVIFPQCSDITHIPLPPLASELVKEPIAKEHFGSLARHRGDSSRGFSRVQHGPKPTDPFKAALFTLWTAVVKPILDTLRFMAKMSFDEIPHVTWCATGPLAFAPLHAAGPYDGLSPNTFDLVISSYAPSLSALLASSGPVSQPQVGLLVVGQEYTKGHSQLPCTVQELAAIEKQALTTPFLRLDSKNATVEAVLNAMDQHSWVHMACHATQDPDNPAHNAFHLHDGSLTLEAITKHRFKDKGLAFLSACQTAKGDRKLPDEAVHLAAGMLMAGYPSVIATMWSIADIDGPEVAGRVYAELLKDGKMGYRDAARALHAAVADLRGKIGEDKFERWVPFVHIGV